MSPAPDDNGLVRALDRALVDHFGSADRADAGEVVAAGCTVVGRVIAGAPDPVTRGVLLAEAQWTLRRVVAEVVKPGAGTGKPKPRGGRPGGS